MIWANNIGGEVLGPIRVRENFEITNAAHSQTHVFAFLLWLTNFPVQSGVSSFFITIIPRPIQQASNLSNPYESKVIV